MFKCKSCDMNSRPKEKPNRVILERREKLYEDKHGEIIGEGWEISKEGFFCTRCKTNKEKLNGRARTTINS